MKTLTEFPAIVLKNAAKTHQELTASGKTPEELTAALGEALKLEGDKLTRLLAALEVVGAKTNDLKRVVVFQLNEGETAPSSVQLKGELYYGAEYYPPAGRAAPQEDSRHGGKGGRGDKKRGDKRGGPGGGGPGGDRGGRPSAAARAPERKGPPVITPRAAPLAPAAAAAAQADTQSTEQKPAQE